MKVKHAGVFVAIVGLLFFILAIVMLFKKVAPVYAWIVHLEILLDIDHGYHAYRKIHS